MADFTVTLDKRVYGNLFYKAIQILKQYQHNQLRGDDQHATLASLEAFTVANMVDSANYPDYNVDV